MVACCHRDDAFCCPVAVGLAALARAYLHDQTRALVNIALTVVLGIAGLCRWARGKQEARTLDNPDLRASTQKNSKHEFRSWPWLLWDVERPTLTAHYHHPDLDVASAKWYAAQAGTETSGMRPNPSVCLDAQRNAGASNGTSPWTPGVHVDVPVRTADESYLTGGFALGCPQTCGTNLCFLILDQGCAYVVAN